MTVLAKMWRKGTSYVISRIEVCAAIVEKSVSAQKETAHVINNRASGNVCVCVHVHVCVLAFVNLFTNTYTHTNLYIYIQRKQNLNHREIAASCVHCINNIMHQGLRYGNNPNVCSADDWVEKVYLWIMGRYFQD